MLALLQPITYRRISVWGFLEGNCNIAATTFLEQCCAIASISSFKILLKTLCM